MCGFLGWFSRDAAAPPPAGAPAALRALAHRGPDDDGTAFGPGWWMGFRRLAILDLSPAGHQPMTFSDGRYTLVFNGEIYNYRELRALVPDHVFRSSGDAEVLGALLQALPLERVLAELRGMFAFLWWDARERTLLAARDPFGMKPLFLSEREGTLALGSELRSLSALSGGARGLDRRWLARYLQFGGPRGAETSWQGIAALPSGGWLRWRAGDGAPMERGAHRPSREPVAPIRNAAAQVAETRRVMLDSLSAHLVSDVPVGLFLSGGLDSSLIASGLHHLGQRQVHAFSIGYAEDAGVPDETDAAERTARHFGHRFHRERLTAVSLLEHLPRFFDQLDQPTQDGLNAWLVSALAAREVKAVMGGTGADEFFGGYNLHRLIRAALALRLPGFLGGGPARRLPSRIRRLLEFASGRHGRDPVTLVEQGRSILPAATAAALAGVSLDPSPAAAVPAGDWFLPVQDLETDGYLAHTLLRDGDAVSMAHSLELRVPFVDREVWRLSRRLPAEAKVRWTRGKCVLREAFRDLLPPWILRDRAKKTFTLPLMKWLRRPDWRVRWEPALENLWKRGWIDPDLARPLVRRYLEAADDGPGGWALAQPVWMFWVLEEWAARRNGGPA